MEKHFCVCTTADCPNHPVNSKNGCDDCIQKNLMLGEIPYCFWNNEVIGKTKHSAVNFAEHILGNDEKTGANQ